MEHDLCNQLDIFLENISENDVEDVSKIEKNESKLIKISEDTEQNNVSNTLSGEQTKSINESFKKTQIHPLRRLKKRSIKKMSNNEKKIFEDENVKMIEEFLKNNRVTQCQAMWARGSIVSQNLPD
jgi:phosphoenolpyruvate carboxylase